MAQTLDSQGNVVQNGFSTNQTPAQFATANIPTAISASSLATPQSPIPVTQPNYNTPTQATQAAQAGAYINNGSITAQQQAEAFAKQQEQAARDSVTQANSTVGALQASTGSKGTDILNAYNQQDASGNSVNSLAAKLRGFSAQSQALSLDNLAKQEAEINKATGQNITQSAVSRNTADATRNNLIQQATIAMQSAIVSADYNSAKSYADQIVEAKYSQKLADIEAAKTNLENLKENLTAAEKKTAQATLERLNNDKLNQELQRDQEKNISDIGLTLRKYGVADSVVNDVLNNSSSVNDALIRAGNNLQDPRAKLELQSLRADIAYKEAQARKADREATLSKEPTAAEKKASAQAVASAQASRQAAQDKVETVDSILNYNLGINARVGTNVLTRGIVGPAIGGAIAGTPLGPVGAVVGAIAGSGKGIASSVSGQGQQLSGAVHQLTSGLTLQTLIEAKQNGATFGSLTDGERVLIASAATKLNDWEIKDSKGNPTGYWNIDEKSFKQEIKTIQDISKRALLKSQGTLISPDESSQLDGYFPQEQPTANQYYQ